MFKDICSFEPCEDPIKKLAVMALAEFMGTYMLIHAIVFSSNFQQPLAPLGIGATLMVCIYAWGHVSGAHYNPAVTTAFWVAGKISAVKWLVYVLTQLIAGLVSGTIAVDICLNRTLGDFASIRFNGSTGLYTEFLWTFLLASVVLNTAASCATGYRNNSFFGLSIGFTVVAGAIAVGGFSGGAFNPAVVLGLNVGDTTLNGYEFSSFAVIEALLFEFFGGIVAGVVFLLTEMLEEQEEGKDVGEKVPLSPFKGSDYGSCGGKVTVKV